MNKETYEKILNNIIGFVLREEIVYLPEEGKNWTIQQHNEYRKKCHTFSRISVMSRKQRDGSNKWVIQTDNGSVMSKEFKEFCYEPQPSNRDDEFLHDTRFNSIEEALMFAEKELGLVLQ